MDRFYIKALLPDGRNRCAKVFAQGPSISRPHIQLCEFVKHFRVKPIFTMKSCQHSFSVSYMICLKLLSHQLATKEVMKSAEPSLHTALQDRERASTQTQAPIEICALAQDSIIGREFFDQFAKNFRRRIALPDPLVSFSQLQATRDRLTGIRRDFYQTSERRYLSACFLLVCKEIARAPQELV